MAGGICVDRALYMLSEAIRLKGVNRDFFSQDKQGRDIPYFICVVRSKSTVREP